MTIPEKHCSQDDNCLHPDGPYLPSTAEYFHRDKSKPCGLNSKCKECTHQYRMEYRAKNAQRERRQQRQHYLENREEVLEIKREWRKENSNKVLDYQRRRDNIKDSLPCDFTDKDREFAIAYFNNRCATCNRQFNDLFGDRRVVFDHWIPVSDEQCPGTIPSNLLPLCNGLDGCNNKKSDRAPNEFLKADFGAKKGREILKRVNAFFSQVREVETLTGKHEREPDHDT